MSIIRYHGLVVSILIASVLSCPLAILCNAATFVVRRPSSSAQAPLQLSLPSRDAVSVWAKARKTTKPPKAAASAAAAASGFGTALTTTNNNKSRSVSGHAGSGTKPLRAAANTFDKLRKEFNRECTNDVYVRSPLNDDSTYWFVGKVARRLENTVGQDIPTPQEAVLSHKRLILEYAKHELRPQNFGGPFAKSLELWLAPGDSEMDVVQNKVTLEKVEGSVADLREGFCVNDVGFNPEIYVGDEVTKGGLRVTRNEEGRPTKPVFDVNESV